MARVTGWILLLLLGSATLCAMAQKMPSPDRKVDDWEYNATLVSGGKKGRALMRMALGAESIGFTVGGARDTANFDDNIAQGYLPKIGAITYEGLFARHRFAAKSQTPYTRLFCPRLATAVTPNLYDAKPEYYLSVGLDSGLKRADFARKLLNIVVVLDISGSMSAPFDAYYYDHGRKVRLAAQERTQSKIRVATSAIVAMMEHLKPHDRLGIVLFDDNAYIAKPLRRVAATDMEAIKRHVLALQARGGTDWSAGYAKARALFERLASRYKDPTRYENRIIFLTDAMPNRGELSERGLFGMVRSASEKGIYTSFVGIGIDFNADLLKAVSAIKGANYFGVHSPERFRQRMDEAFDYWVTPLVFDLKMELVSGDFTVEALYGAPESDRAHGTLMHLGTLFPSSRSQDGIKGGIILAKLHPKNAHPSLATIRLSYTERNGTKKEVTRKVRFRSCCYYDDLAIRKAIWLARYGTLMQNWLIDAHRGCDDRLASVLPLEALRAHAFIYPPDRPDYPQKESWERTSCPLQVSPGYHDLFALFARSFHAQIAPLHDPSLDHEYETLQRLIRLHPSTEVKR